MKNKIKKIFLILASLNIFITFVLIIWGATVTSTHSGLAVSDWPLSFGKLNPEGWWRVKSVFWEHSHRLIASILSLSVTFLFFLIWKNEKKICQISWIEFFSIISLGATILTLAIIEGKNDKTNFLNIRMLSIYTIVITLFSWIFYGWKKRGWNLVLTLVSLSFVSIFIQAVMGGLRVTELSDVLGAVHGVFAQLFFCLQLWLLFEMLPTRQSSINFTIKQVNIQKIISTIIFVSIIIQLALGATIRHTHRLGLPVDKDDFPFLKELQINNTDSLSSENASSLTVTKIFPKHWNFDLALHLAHRYWGYFILLILVLTILYSFKYGINMKKFISGQFALVFMILMQVFIGASIIWTGKHQHTTVFHLIVGLLILSKTFLILYRSHKIVLADP